MKSATWNEKKGEWVYPQVYYLDKKPIAKKKLIEQIDANECVQEAVQIEPRVKALIEQAKQQRCVQGYNLLTTFYDYYKPRIVELVGWSSPHKALRTGEHYDAVYEAIYALLPADDVDLYSEGIMPNGMYSPNLQEKYGREYP